MPANFSKIEVILGKAPGKAVGIHIFVEIAKDHDIVINCLP